MRANTRNSLYWLVQQSVLGNRRGLAAEEHLRKLSDAFGPIFRAYQDSMVAVDYTTPGATEAYRLHYGPHYAWVAYRGLVALPRNVFRRVADGALAYHAVAAGPFPEIIGLVEAATAHGVERGRIAATVWDIAADTWRHAARESVSIARQLSPDIEIDLAFEQADVSTGAPRVATPSDLVTMQNCLNELSHDGVPGENVLTFARTIRRGGGLVVTDLSKYGPTRRAIRALEQALPVEGFTQVARFDDGHTEVSPFWRPVPRDTFFHFYGFRRSGEDGPWECDYPPKKNLNFSWSAWTR